MIRTLMLLAAALFAAPAGAYWEYGHETVARIAQANVRPATAARIRALLARSAVLDTPECPARTMAEASVWADCIKPLKDAAGRSRFGYAYAWHYQNVDICRPFDPVPACKDGNCVSAQIERQQALLANRTAATADRVRALAFLIHLVGDLHQPLHAGDKADRGGNDARAAYGIYAPERLNLHSVWDGLLAERAITDGPSLIRRYPAAERRRLAAGTVADWGRESWQVSRDVAYAAIPAGACTPTPARIALTDAAIAAAVPPLRGELRNGGLRLARLLDAALGQAT